MDDFKVVSSAEVQRNFSEFRQLAEAEPVIVQHYNKPAVVIVSYDEFCRLKKRDQKVFTDETMPDWVIEKIVDATMDPRHNHLDEVK